MQLRLQKTVQISCMPVPGIGSVYHLMLLNSLWHQQTTSNNNCCFRIIINEVEIFNKKLLIGELHVSIFREII